MSMLPSFRSAFSSLVGSSARAAPAPAPAPTRALRDTSAPQAPDLARLPLEALIPFAPSGLGASGFDPFAPKPSSARAAAPAAARSPPRAAGRADPDAPPPPAPAADDDNNTSGPPPPPRPPTPASRPAKRARPALPPAPTLPPEQAGADTAWSPVPPPPHAHPPKPPPPRWPPPLGYAPEPLALDAPRATPPSQEHHHHQRQLPPPQHPYPCAHQGCLDFCRHGCQLHAPPPPPPDAAQHYQQQQQQQSQQPQLHRQVCDEGHPHPHRHHVQHAQHRHLPQQQQQQQQQHAPHRRDHASFHPAHTAATYTPLPGSAVTSAQPPPRPPSDARLPAPRPPPTLSPSTLSTGEKIADFEFAPPPRPGPYAHSPASSHDVASRLHPDPDNAELQMELQYDCMYEQYVELSHKREYLRQEEEARHALYAESPRGRPASDRPPVDAAVGGASGQRREAPEGPRTPPAAGPLAGQRRSRPPTHSASGRPGRVSSADDDAQAGRAAGAAGPAADRSRSTVTPEARVRGSFGSSELFTPREAAAPPGTSAAPPPALAAPRLQYAAPPEHGAAPEAGEMDARWAEAASGASERGGEFGGAGAASVQCPLCSRRLMNNVTLNNHIRVVHDKCGDFQCEDCQARFMWRSTLGNHIRLVHQRDRPHGCSLCNLRFRWKSHLKEHVTVVHEKKQPHCCEKCGKSFGRKNNCMKHFRRCQGDANGSGEDPAADQ